MNYLLVIKKKKIKTYCASKRFFLFSFFFLGFPSFSGGSGSNIAGDTNLITIINQSINK